MASTSNVQFLNLEDEDYKLIFRLLEAKVHGDPLPSDANVDVHECDLFGEKNPWEIWELLGGGKGGSRELYIFSILRMNMASREVVHTIGSGSWEDQHNDGKIVCTETKQDLAVRKCFLFGKSGTSHDGAWIMHEYRLLSSHLLTRPPSAFRPKPSSNYSHVLCKLIKNQGRIRLRTMGQERGVTIMLPFPPNSPASTNNNQAALRLVGIGSGQVQAEGADKRLAGEKSTPDEENDQ